MLSPSKITTLFFDGSVAGIQKNRVCIGSSYRQFVAPILILSEVAMKPSRLRFRAALVT